MAMHRQAPYSPQQPQQPQQQSYRPSLRLSTAGSSMSNGGPGGYYDPIAIGHIRPTSGAGQASPSEYYVYAAPTAPAVSYVSTLRRQRATVWSDKSQNPAPSYVEKKIQLKAGMKRMMTSSSAHSSLRKNSGEAAPQYSMRIPRLSESEARDSDEDDGPVQPQPQPQLQHPSQPTSRTSTLYSPVDSYIGPEYVPLKGSNGQEHAEKRVHRAISSASVMSVDERTHTMGGRQRLFVANPDLP